MEKSKKITKDSNNFKKWILLTLGEFKSDQLFVEKTKLVTNLYTTISHDILSNKLCAVQQIISKITEENNCFKFNYSLMLGEC